MKSVSESEKGIVRRDRSYHVVPADWARYGTHQSVPLGYDRFYVEAVCYERRIERDAETDVGVRETHRLYVLYRNPETGEAVERPCGAAAINTERDRVRVPFGNGRPAGEWTSIEFDAIRPESSLAIVPKAVHAGEPANFRASVAVHPSEPRVAETAAESERGP